MSKIPEEVYYIYNEDKHDISVTGKSDISAHKIKIVNAAKEKKAEREFNIAQRGDYSYKTRSYSTKPAHKIKVKNEPKSGYTVLGSSAQQKSYFNILDPGGYVFQIHESILMHIITGPGVKAGGKLNGKYIWGSTRKGMTLIPHNSALEKELLRTNKSGKIKAKNLKPGTIYKNGYGQKKLFIGRVNTKRVSKRWSAGVYKFKLKEIKNGFLWIDVPRMAKHDTLSLSTIISEYAKSYWMNITTTPSVYSVVKSFDSKDPSLNIENVRKIFEKNNISLGHVSTLEADTADTFNAWTKIKKADVAEYLNMCPTDTTFTFPPYKDFFKDLIVGNIVDA